MLILFVCVISAALLAVAILLHLDNIKDGKKKSNSISFYESLHLTGLPIITFAQGKNKFNFILDSGAAVSVINKDTLNYLKHTSLTETANCYGVEGNRMELSSVEATFQYKNNAFTEKFRVMDMTSSFNVLKRDTGVTAHGLLSSAFLKKYKYILDYKDFVAYPNK